MIDAQAVAATVHRVAVLLQAGLPPARAWEQLSGTGEPVAAAIAARAAQGAALGDAVTAGGGAWREVGTAWRVAETVGAPLAHSLRTIADALRDAQASRDDVRVALAEPAATARLIAWLPLAAAGLSALLGFDLVRALGHPLGIACVLCGLLLMLLARRWSGRLVARAQPDAVVPGLHTEIVAIALSAGVSIERALAVVARAGGGEPTAEVVEVLALSRETGAPAVELLRATAALERHAARTEGRLRAARLSSRLLLPLGICTLPAFLLLGVGPMLLSVLGAASPSL
ncbi:type II secretion system F family protein [Microbacterium sp.]|uniref:type II secretion system F family protein n=1 Tax=Microbacterium sp. TaxID=51671 RepID=UPI0039E37EF9